MIRGLHFGALALATSGVIACSGSSGTSGAGQGGNGAAATFTQVYSDVLSPQCASTCHKPGGIGVASGKLDMSTQTAAFTNLNMAAQGVGCSASTLPRITAGNADKSLLYLKVSLDAPAPCGEHMPLGAGNLMDTQVQEIESWINAGAKDD
jgi:hypothetical protein